MVQSSKSYIIRVALNEFYPWRKKKSTQCRMSTLVSVWISLYISSGLSRAAMPPYITQYEQRKLLNENQFPLFVFSKRELRTLQINKYCTIFTPCEVQIQEVRLFCRVYFPVWRHDGSRASQTCERICTNAPCHDGEWLNAKLAHSQRLNSLYHFLHSQHSQGTITKRRPKRTCWFLSFTSLRLSERIQPMAPWYAGYNLVFYSYKFLEI